MADVLGEYGDFDGDGLSNLEEYQLGLDPTVRDAAGRPGTVLAEFWDGIEGVLVDEQIADARFPGEPDRSQYLDGLEYVSLGYFKYGTGRRCE